MSLLEHIPGMSVLGYIVPFLAVLTVVVFFHELGHFLVARWNGVKVDAFSIGFGPELAGFNDARGTRWRISAIPLGGYVKFHGDADAASTPDFERAGAMSESEKSVSFMYKRVSQRAAIVAAGPIANFILAIVIFSISFMTMGRPLTDPLVSKVLENSAAQDAGFQPGDVVVSIDGTRIRSFTEIPPLVAPNPGRAMRFVVLRDGKEVDLEVTPRLTTQTDRFGNRHESGVIGLENDTKQANFRIEKLGPAEAVGAAAAETWSIVANTVGYLGDIVTGFRSADQLGGPIRIAKISGDVATLGIAALINLAAVLSVSIGLLNLFPIPMLDGGHLVFYAVEALRGRPLSDGAQEVGFRIGLAIVLMLMFFATWNDLTQLVFNAG